LQIHFGNETAQHGRQIAQGGRRVNRSLEPTTTPERSTSWRQTSRSGGNARKGAVKKRSQFATKTMGKKTFTKRNKEGGQFMAQKEKTKFKGVRKEEIARR
jgi:hypothetical protein